jgi:integrase
MEGRAEAGYALSAPEAARTTLGEALVRYLKEITPGKKGAIQEAVRIRAWLRSPLSERSLASIRTTDLAQWRSARIAAGKSTATVRNALTIISQVYKVAASEWGMEGLRNPVRDVRLPKLGPARDRRLEPGEEELLLEACARSSNPWLRPDVSFAIHTAMRRGEILSLQRQDVKGRIALLRSKTVCPR